MPEAPRFVAAAAVEAALPFPALIDALRRAFAAGGTAPVRHHHAVPRAGTEPATLLLMPAWQPDEVTGVKLVHIAPGNQTKGLPTVQGLYVLFDGPTGTPLLILDGTSLTLRRTAAASALAASYLARPDARRLLIIGAGALAASLARAHRAVRPIEEIRVWNRTPARAERLAEELRAEGVDVRSVTDLEGAVGRADVITCATMSSEPLVRGGSIEPGTHVDLVGAFTPEMRESDGELMARADVFVDTLDGALAEAGDVLQAIAEGRLDRTAIRGDLFGLCRGERAGRTDQQTVTVFKSVGTALEDLAAARLVHQRLAQPA